MLAKALTNPFVETPEHADPAVKQLLADIRECRYSSIFTKRNNYQSLKAFKAINTIARLYFIFCEKGLACLPAKTLHALIDYVLSLQTEGLEVDAYCLLLSSLHLLHGLVLKENWTGPSYLFKQADKVLKEELKVDSKSKYELELNDQPFLAELLDVVEVKAEEFNNFDFRRVKTAEFLKRDYSKLVDQELAINGEDFTRQLKLLDLFVLYAKSVEYLLERPEHSNSLELNLMQARVYNLHTQILENPTSYLKTRLINAYQTALGALRPVDESSADIELFCCVKLEYALVLLNYFRYKESKALILEVMSLFGIEVSFTGKLGIKTKYQTFKVPQLVVEVNKTSSADDQPSKMEETDQKPTVKQLDEIFDNILYEKPVFEELTENKDLTLKESLVIMALIKITMKSHAMDDMLKAQINAYLTKAIDPYHNWSILLDALILRSNLEFSNFKRMERAMIQYEQISKDWHSKTCQFSERAKFVYFLHFPHYISVMTTFAENYKKTNCLMSAAALFEDCGLFEEAIECKAMAGNHDQAVDLLKKMPESIANSPKMLCVLGDIYKDPKYYLKAWEESSCRSVRAQKSLARHYFSRKQYDQALEHYKQAVSLNEMLLLCWMNMGYIYMNQQDVKSSIMCYSKAVFIDVSQSQAWANLAVLYKSEQRYSEAFTAIQEAVKINERNWMMWYNYLIIAMQEMNFTAFVKGCLKLVELNHPEQLKDFIVAKFVIILEHEFSAKNNAASFRQIELLANK